MGRVAVVIDGRERGIGNGDELVAGLSPGPCQSGMLCSHAHAIAQAYHGSRCLTAK